ncbi:MAG TPA: choice-of-anchor Q domain-containing protein, partial [Bacteroidales bacterium]
NLSIENNLFYNNDSANRADFGTLTIANKTAKNNKIGNPLFVSSPGFHLKAGSPAIDAGIDVGLPYKGSAPDMGAFESK